MRKMVSRIFNIIKNRYIFTLIVFLVWMVFFDQHNFISQYRKTKQLTESQQIKDYYLNEIRKDSIAAMELMTDMENLEKFGREQYLMKRNDEDIFLIIRNNPL